MLAQLFWLGEHQLDSLKLVLSKARGVSRVDESKVLSIIIHVLRYGLRWVDAPPVDGSCQPLYNCFRR